MVAAAPGVLATTMRPRSRAVVEQAADVVLRGSGLLGVLRRFDLRRNAGVLRVLCYHRVGDPAADPLQGHPGVISASPRAFDEQIRLVARHYAPVGIEDLRASLADGRPLPAGATLVTFDDGYRDFLTHAWPILRRHGVPAIVFVPTAYPDSGRPFWWDELSRLLLTPETPAVVPHEEGPLDLGTARGRWAALTRLRNELWTMHPKVIERRMVGLRVVLGMTPVARSSVLGWDDLRMLAREGAVIASHGRTHASMPSLTEEELEQEIDGSQADLERELGAAHRVFAYPFGHYDARMAAVLETRGFLAAFGVTPGHRAPQAGDRFRLPRQLVNATHSFSRVQLGLSGLYPRHFLRRSHGGLREGLVRLTRNLLVSRSRVP